MGKCDNLMATKFEKYLASYQHSLFFPEALERARPRWSKNSPIEKAVCERRHILIKKLCHQVITFTKMQIHHPLFF
jgi:hypothetical protein